MLMLKVRINNGTEASFNGESTSRQYQQLLFSAGGLSTTRENVLVSLTRGLLPSIIRSNMVMPRRYSLWSEHLKGELISA